MNDDLLFTPLKSTRWMETLETLLKAGFSEHNPKWAEHIDHLLNHPDTEKARRVFLDNNPDHVIDSFTRCLHTVIVLRYDLCSQLLTPPP